MKRAPRKPACHPAAPAFFSKEVARARRFYLDLNPDRHVSLSVVCGGLEHCTTSYAIHRDTFPFYSIEYVVRGSGSVKLHGRTYDLLPGRLFSYGPRIPHHITGDPADPLVKYFVDFSGTDSIKTLDACGLPAGQVSTVYPAHSLQALFDEIINAGLQMRRGEGILCRKLIECLALKIETARAPLEGAENLAFGTYQQCRQFIEAHFLRLQTLEQIAAECHVDDAYLCRLFRRYDQQTPYQYLLRLKMNLAAERLQQKSTLVKQVAAETGFSDPFHFSRVFTKVFGISPAAFRNLR